MICLGRTTNFEKLILQSKGFHLFFPCVPQLMMGIVLNILFKMNF